MRVSRIHEVPRGIRPRRPRNPRLRSVLRSWAASSHLRCDRVQFSPYPL